MKERLKHKTKFAAIALVMLMTSVMLTLYIPVPAQGQGGTEPEIEPPPGSSATIPAGVTPELTFKTIAYMSFRPDPIGIGQQLLVNIWVTPPPTNDRVFKGFEVTITDPDGDVDVIGPFNSYEADGTSWLEYVPDKAGEWTLKFKFPGQYFPNGTYKAPGGRAAGTYYAETQYYEPAETAEQTLTVQEEMVLSWPPAELPSYWERPISPYNREWYSVAGPYPWPWTNWAKDWMGPWITAPNSAHIVWKKQLGVAGIIGGAQYTESEHPNVGYPTVIYAGRCYQTYDKPGVGEVAACYDIRTGEVFYEIPMAEGGSTPGTLAFDGDDYDLIAGTYGTGLGRGGMRTVTGDTLIKVDPWTGETREFDIVPLRDGVFHNGAYVLGIQDLGPAAGTERYRLINWTTNGNTNNFANRIISNISYAWYRLPSYAKIDFDSGVAIQDARFTEGLVAGGWLSGISLKTGAVLWNITYPAGETPFHSGVTPISDDGKIAICMEHRYFNCYDVKTGKLLWKSEETPYPWGDFWGYDASSHGDLFYAGNYVGMYAFNWDDGTIAWEYHAPSIPFETPYAGEYSWHSATIIADGKLFSYTDEHSETQPLTRGWRFYALNATTGEEIWSMGGYNGDARTFSGSCSDGYLVVSDEYSGSTICFGKGKSETTVTVSPKVTALGATVLIEGTVLDLSPAQPGTPCVSKESMRTQMEYIHMQQPIDGIWHNETITGVPVSLDTVDPNGNFIHIGDVTTDGYSGTFSHMWTPEIPGEYQVMATFMGDDSYGSSFGQTAVGVGEAPEPYPEPPEYGSDEWPEYPEAPAYTSVDLAIIAAIVVVAVLVVYDIFGRKR